MPHSPRLPVLLASVLMVMASLTACGNGSTQAGPPITTCDTAFELRDANGRIDLSGDWTANDQGRYKLKHIGDCLTWVGLSDFEDQTLGDSWITTFRGRVRSDRTISGEFLDVFGTNQGSGTLTLRIADSPDAFGGLTLDMVQATGSPFGGSFWERARPPEPDESVEPGETLPPATSPPPAGSEEPVVTLPPGESPTEGPPQSNG